MDMEAVFRKPKLLRALTSLEASEFARNLGVYPSTLSRWERGMREPKGEYLDRVNRIVA
jgi:DNA-binding transcriptional regulator YiaG